MYSARSPQAFKGALELQFYTQRCSLHCFYRARTYVKGGVLTDSVLFLKPAEFPW